ncbi:transporter substrate-binding domain-containing protein [uncultured Gilvimarinus sp.]|uniref:transporter substrate-binding domain-containing protein n=1 Tax=uncultured Gilvimarinus sp. TaxID=1689143 RepID=UPI0030ED9AD0|tara:strand:- start:1980 stop:2777 length:798 start_codon:yes stop_codon:yes gene_type:complete
MVSIVKNFFRTAALALCCLSAGVSADALNDILDRGTIRVGVAQFTPWTMKNEKGELTGFDVDVARKIAADMGVKVEFVEYEWDKILPSLAEGKVDMVAAGVAITPKRALQVEFTNPYSESGVGLAANIEKTRNVKTLAEMNNKDFTIAVVRDTIAFDVSSSLFKNAEVKVFETSKAAEQAVLDGKAHAYIASQPVVTYFSVSNSKKIDLPMNAPLLSYKNGLAVHKGEQSLLNFLNAWIVARTADKWLPASTRYWFTSLEWKEAQ